MAELAPVRPSIMETGRVICSVDNNEFYIDGLQKWQPPVSKRDSRAYMDLANWPFESYLPGKSSLEPASFSALWYPTNPSQLKLLSLARQKDQPALWKFQQGGYTLVSGTDLRVAAGGKLTFGAAVKPPSTVGDWNPRRGDRFKAPTGANPKTYIVNAVDDATGQLTVMLPTGAVPAVVAADTAYDFGTAKVELRFTGYLGDAPLGMGMGEEIVESDFTVFPTGGTPDLYIDDVKFDYDAFFKAQVS